MATRSEDVFEAKFGADASQFLAEVKKIDAKTLATLYKIDQATQVLDATFQSLTRVISATTADFIAYEKQLIGVQKTTNLSDEEVNKLGDSLVELSKKGPVSTSTLLEIAEAAGQLGIEGSDNIVKFTDIVSKLGLTTNLAGGEAATILARIIGLTGDGVQDVDKLGSAFVRLGNNVKANEAEIATLALEVAKSTSIFKLGSSNVTGLSATLAELGVQAEVGGSVIGRTFIAIRKAIDDGGKSAKDLSKATGIAVEDLSKQFGEDANGVFLKFIKRLKEVIDSGGNVTSFLDTFGLKGAGVQKVITPLANSFERLERNLGLSSAEFSKATALQEEYNKAASSTSAQLQTAKNSLTAASKTLGEQFAPTIISVTSKITELINWFNSFDETTVNVIARIGLAAGAVTGVITALGLATKAVIALRLAFIALTAASGPLGLFITAITTAGVALATFYATAPDEAEKGGKDLTDQQKKNNENFKKAVEEGNTEVEGLQKKSNEKITEDFKKSNEKRLKEIERLQLKRQELLRSFDEEAILKDKEAAKNQLEIEKVSLEALQLERNGASQEAIDLKNQELESLRTIQNLRLESAKVSAKDEKTALELITLERNKSLLELENEKLKETRDNARNNQDLQFIDIGDFEQRTQDLIEESFNKKAEIQERKLKDIDTQLNSLAVKGSYPNRIKDLQEHNKKEEDENFKHYQNEISNLILYYEDRKKVREAYGDPGGPSPGDGDGEATSSSFSSNSVSSRGVSANVASLSAVNPSFTSASINPDTSAIARQQFETNNGARLSDLNNVKLEISFTDDAFGIITAKQVEQDKLRLL